MYVVRRTYSSRIQFNTGPIIGSKFSKVHATFINTQCLPHGLLVAIDVYYREPSFSFSNLDELRRWIELILGEVKNRSMIRHVAYFVKDSPKVRILAYIAHWICNVYYRRL